MIPHKAIHASCYSNSPKRHSTSIKLMNLMKETLITITHKCLNMSQFKSKSRTLPIRMKQPETIKKNIA
ncbi:CLUMA_CG012314, isoform A [Clunio marinus]|uniref:CLUMA_CG012314, isoform A n=1 Tax=Clunio marinus TaxID=568069 RepID=A0A1J1IEI1_9DIPT|nr:CLUMA_CG012314, isoform A [Clunio marinus]